MPAKRYSMAGKDSTFDLPGTQKQRCPGQAEALCFVAGSATVRRERYTFLLFLLKSALQIWEHPRFRIIRILQGQFGY
jgi:hypothetical protein